MMKEIKISLFSVFCRQSWWLILFCLLLFAGCYFALQKVPPMYIAQAVINVEKREYGLEELAFRAEGTETAVGNTIHFLRSDALLDKTLKQLGYRLDGPHRKLLKHLLRVDRISSGSLIKVSLIYTYPQEASMIVNTLIETLMAEEKEKRLSELAETKSYLQAELRKIKTRKGQAPGGVRSNGQASDSPLTVRPAVKIRQKEYLQTIDGDIRYTKGKIQYYLTALHADERKAMEKTLTPNHWILKSVRAKLETEEEKLVKSLLAGGWEAPQVKKAMTDIWRLKTRTADAFKKHYNTKLPGPDNIKNALYIFYINLYDLQIRREQLLKGNHPLSIVAAKTGSSNRAPEEQAEERVWQETETKLLSRLVELEAIEGMVSSDLTWVEQAIPTGQPFFPTRRLVMGLSLLVVFIFAWICLLVGYSHDKKWQRALPQPGRDLE